jgi:hypothetical protein
MTEYNTFCYSESYNDENSFQQKRFRVFNKELEKEEYFSVKNKVEAILDGLKLELNENSWTEEWEKVTSKQWVKLFELAVEVRGDNFKEGFEFISGINLDFVKEPVEDVTEEEIKMILKFIKQNLNIIAKVIELLRGRNEQ